jgi:hypothetical protein
MLFQSEPAQMSEEDSTKNEMVQMMMKMGLPADQAKAMLQRMLQMGMTMEDMKSMMANPGNMAQMMSDMMDKGMGNKPQQPGGNPQKTPQKGMAQNDDHWSLHKK